MVNLVHKKAEESSGSRSPALFCVGEGGKETVVRRTGPGTLDESLGMWATTAR